MALSKAVEYKGLDVPDGYHKIGRVIVSPVIVDEVKMYKVDLDIELYADANKENLLYADPYSFTVAEDGMTYANFYKLLKETDNFAEAKDV